MFDAIIKLANDFSNKIEEEFGPVSMERVPISIERHKDLVGSIREDVRKNIKHISPIFLENTQKTLADLIANSLTRHGFPANNQDIYKELLKFGEYNRAEEELLHFINKAITDYSDKATHFVVNNLSW